MKKLFLLFLLLNFAAQAQQQIKWPNNKKAVIVLTYDDALLTQLNTAVPQLDAARLKATFFITGDVNSQTISRWRKLGQKGYELANHTLFHPCASSNDNPVSSDNYTAYRMIREIEVMNHFLYAIDGKTSRTYAYPCTEITAGGKSYVDTLKYYNLVKYARIGGDSNAVITDFKNLDPLQVPSYGIKDNTTGAQLIAFVKRVQQSGGMGVLMFHGIGGDYITTPAEAHKQLLAYLNKNRKEIWVATFQQAMDYITEAGKSNSFVPLE
ncbi:peptidoglycan/xylan/chitin deacetylase (PgdA/CDA1 family) [Mucilaginibacter gracilis]|uniref:Peptidoglycan/xylan/chitin deacetylase (PgdA/CDA1 family) n=1 Tax=Mucilaginibacter gracilis TaxID=423350 RepID=A0A495J8S9_9SPHI|nr:polysaccharide deacetylase family protein [Mucilaginibacter gracilis]RKR85183.1 peptidoglycan/xylan/chitin deacetylase (PgdA/CDA1 family) [Mucilaginibacter gracilis]